MKRALIAAVAALTCVGSAHADEARNQLRQNLVSLSIAPAEFAGQTKRVFCPIEQADTDMVTCLVLNEHLRVIGREFLFVENVDIATYRDILNRCDGEFGRMVGDDCAYLVDVFVETGYGSTTLMATKFQKID